MSEKRKTLGLLIDHINSEYSAMLIGGIKSACKDFNIQLLIFPIGELHNISVPYNYQNVSIAALVTKKNLDGVIVAAGPQMHYMTKAELTSYVKSFQPLPQIAINEELTNVPSITVDCSTAYEQVISHLIEQQQCKRFCILSVRGNSDEVKSRTKCIKQCLQQKFIPSDDILILKGIFEYATTLKVIEEYYKTAGEFNYDAIIALNDEMAFAGMDFCRSIGKRVPEDVAIVGFDDIERASFSTPSLTSITQDIAGQGYASVIYMKEILESASKEKHKVLDSKLILRDSTCRKTPLSNIVDRSNTLSATEWYSKKAQLYHITRFYTDIQTDITLDTFKKRINQDMKSFGLKACAIVIYDNPVDMPTPYDYFNLPHKATLFSAFDYSTFYDSSTIKKTVKFDPNENMVPDGVLYYEGEEMYVMSLYHNEVQYGYMVFRPGDFDVAIYDLLARFLGTIISQVHTYTQAHNEQSKFKAKNKMLDLMARTDELTGILNRRGLYDLGQTTLKFAKSMNQTGIVVYCDMDGLKKINDKYGHEAGDLAIATEAGILKNNFRSNDVVARIGGDEFAIISLGLTNETFLRIRKNIEKDCEEWKKENNVEYSLSISMGAVTFPSVNDGYSIISLLAEADSMLYKEKNAKKQKK